METQAPSKRGSLPPEQTATALSLICRPTFFTMSRRQCCATVVWPASTGGSGIQAACSFGHFQLQKQVRKWGGARNN